MIGYGNLIIALVGDGPPTALKAYVSDPAAWPRDAFGRYELVHAALTFVIVGSFVLPIYLYRDIQRRTRSRSRAVGDPSMTPPTTNLLGGGQASPRL